MTFITIFMKIGQFIHGRAHTLSTANILQTFVRIKFYNFQFLRKRKKYAHDIFKRT